MYPTATVADACRVEKPTIRSWLGRAPGFEIGEYQGAAKYYSQIEAMTLIIASELIARGLGVPSDVLPLAAKIAERGSDHTAWVSLGPGDQLTVHDVEPASVAVCLPLPVLAARLGLAGRQRIARQTR